MTDREDAAQKHPAFGLQPNGDVICRGCRHDIPEHADCRRRSYEGGFPEGDCWEAE